MLLCVPLFKTYVYRIFSFDFYILVNRLVLPQIVRGLQPNARATKSEKWRGQTNAALCFKWLLVSWRFHGSAWLLWFQSDLSIATTTSQIYSLRMDHNRRIWQRTDVTDALRSNTESKAIPPRSGHGSWQHGLNGSDPLFDPSGHHNLRISRPETRRNPLEFPQSPGALGRSTRVPSVLRTKPHMATAHRFW